MCYLVLKLCHLKNGGTLDNITLLVDKVVHFMHRLSAIAIASD